MMLLVGPAPTPAVTELPGVVEDPTKIAILGLEVPAIAGIIAVFGLVVLVTWILVRSLISAGKLPPPTSLVTALSVLTMLAIAGGIFSDNDEAWTIAAAGIGALAGSVTAVFRDERDNTALLDRAMAKLEERSARKAARQAAEVEGEIAADEAASTALDPGKEVPDAN